MCRVLVPAESKPDCGLMFDVTITNCRTNHNEPSKRGHNRGHRSSKLILNIKAEFGENKTCERVSVVVECDTHKHTDIHIMTMNKHEEEAEKCLKQITTMSMLWQ